MKERRPVKGRSWDDCLVLLDEAEDIDPEVAKSLVGRQGIITTTVITGDLAQQDLKRHSGLQLLLDVAEYAGMKFPLSISILGITVFVQKKLRRGVWPFKNMKTVTRSFLYDAAR